MPPRPANAAGLMWAAHRPLRHRARTHYNLRGWMVLRTQATRPRAACSWTRAHRTRHCSRWPRTSGAAVAATQPAASGQDHHGSPRPDDDGMAAGCGGRRCCGLAV
eukprot:COSAG01_NODE_226_length_21147_cov_59.226435_19_plen_106_part_00